MNIHEYQAKDILRKYGVPVPRSIPAFSADEAERAAKDLIAETGNEVVVVKAQIHAGGRGKGGGVKVVKGADAATETARKMLGMTLVTHQTGPGGRVVKRLLIEQGMNIARELYAGMLVDRGTGRVVVMASSEGAWTSRRWPPRPRRRS
jgi:succinyl-CoA synthetase beta subunit